MLFYPRFLQDNNDHFILYTMTSLLQKGAEESIMFGSSGIIWIHGEYMSCNELFEAFLAAKQHTFASHTLRVYRYDLTMFARSHPDLLIHDITESHLRFYLDAKNDLKTNTMARRKATLHSCFRWAHEQGLLPADPTAQLTATPFDRRLPRPLTEKQVQAILDVIPPQELRNRLLLTLLYETGMRVGEALKLQPQHVHINPVDGGYLQAAGKGNKTRVIRLMSASRSVALLQELLTTLVEGDSLFSGDVNKGGHHGKAMNYTTIRHHFERYVDQARSRYSELFVDTKGPITIHQLRHTFASIKLRDGIGVDKLSELLGHSSTQLTKYYTRANFEMVEHGFEKSRFVDRIAGDIHE